LILDGAAVVADSRGIPDFGLLHADLAAGRKDRLLYYAFDLLYVDGLDLRGARLADRKRLLSELLAGLSERILCAEHLEGNGPEIYKRACAMSLEGIVSKQQDAPYRSGRVESWIKVKYGNSDAFPIVAFVEKLGAKPRRIASLYVGRREGDRLLYAGKVRSGYTEAVARDLRERLDPFIRKDSPLSEPVKKPKATWVEPVLEAEVAYSTVTENALLREAVFKGLREDRADPPAPSRARISSRTADNQSRTGVPRENILQLLPDAVPPSKEKLAIIGRRSRSAPSHISGTGRSSSFVTSKARRSITWGSCRLYRRRFISSRSKSANVARACGCGSMISPASSGLSRSARSSCTRGMHASTTSSIPTCSCSISIPARASPGSS
jgi:bifunctional non-homologous end joining protein LigD